MTTRRWIDPRRRIMGAAVILTFGVAACWAQQQKSGLGPGASTQLQQQRAALEQSKTPAANQVSASTPNPRSNGNNPVFPAASGDETPAFFQDSARTRRNDERQKRLVTDAQRLLTLANQLKSEVATSGAESMTPEMLRQMDEIEKLAKSVKDRMRS